MKRRSFFSSLLKVAVIAPFSRAEGLVMNFNQEEIKELVKDRPNFIQSDTIVKMPLSAQHGDKVHLVVESQSLHSPCKLICAHSSIVGEKDPLILDQIATVVFTYDAYKQDWVL